jgi:hypothetical protein
MAETKKLRYIALNYEEKLFYMSMKACIKYLKVKAFMYINNSSTITFEVIDQDLSFSEFFSRNRKELM